MSARADESKQLLDQFIASFARADAIWADESARAKTAAVSSQERLDAMESATLARMDAMESAMLARMDAMEARLAALEAALPPPSYRACVWRR